MNQIMKNEAIRTSWYNRDNAAYYNNISLNLLYEWETLAGLNTGADIDVLESYIHHAGSILELGAGYGRVLNALLKRHYTNPIVAVERCPRFQIILEKQFADNVTVVKQDISHLNLDRTFDLILWMWTGFCEFSQEEQLPVLKKIIHYLNKGGYLIIDSLQHMVKAANATDIAEQQQTIHIQDDTLIHAYFSSYIQMYRLANKLNLSSCKEMSYTTSTGKSRLFYILQK